jgi:hypothetical protein
MLREARWLVHLLEDFRGLRRGREAALAAAPERSEQWLPAEEMRALPGRYADRLPPRIVNRIAAHRRGRSPERHTNA